LSSFSIFSIVIDLADFLAAALMTLDNRVLDVVTARSRGDQ